MKKILFGFLLVLQLASGGQAAAQDPYVENIDRLIQFTDQIKTTDAVQLKKNLELLQSMLGRATSFQADFIAYLVAYELVLDGEFDAAIQGFQRLIDETQHQKVMVRAAATLANIQAINRNYEDALKKLDLAINEAAVLNDQALKNKVFLIASIAYYLMDFYDLSAQYAELVFSTEPDQVMFCKSKVYFMSSLLKLDQQVAETEVRDIITTCKENNELIYSSLLFLDWFDAELESAREQNNRDRIRALLQELKSISDEIDGISYRNLISLKHASLATAYYLDEQHNEAAFHASQVIKMNNSSGHPTQVANAIKILLQLAVDNSDYEMALQWSQKLNEIEQNIYLEGQAKEMAFVSVKHDLLSKQLAIDNLKKDNQLLSLEKQLAVESKRTQSLLMLLGAGFLVLLGLWSYKLKRRHDYYQNISEIDHLTQVFSRKAIEERIPEIIKSCEGQKQPLNVAIFDLDHFKNINDDYGHLVGDWVLQQVIVACESVLDEDVLMGRLGGEEFVVIVPAISQLAHARLLEKMRAAIEQLDTAETGHDFTVTASFGATSSLQSGFGWTQLLTDADEALFVAKDNGRNQIQFKVSQPNNNR